MKVEKGDYYNDMNNETKYKESSGSYTCPVTNEHCDDECCTSPEHCNIQAGIDIGISNCEPEFMSESAPPSWEDAFEKDVCIHFAKWIAPSWMGIWVEDKWLWECLDEDMPKEHMGYKTEEELYELYLKSI
jgi:hypothetical protein